MGALGRSRAATLALAGFGFWVVVVVGLPVLTTDPYDPVAQSISALALVRFGGFMDAAFLAFGLGSVALALGLHWSVGVLLAPLLLASCGCLWSLLAFFRTGSGGIGEAVHDAAATASFVLIVVVMFLFARGFRGDERWRSLARPTAVWAVFSTGALLAIPLLGEEVFGASERLFVSAFVSWLIAAAGRLRLTDRGDAAGPRTRAGRRRGAG